jgi:DGQHR domain-containing protein
MTCSQPQLVEVKGHEARTSILSLPALEVRQGNDRTLYSFAVDGKQLPTFATISRIRRDGDAEIQGYQRPEVLAHISAIRRYIESDAPMIPNALVVAFDKRVRFEPLPDVPATGYARPGTILIPVEHGASEEEKPGWIVDGQQRSAAIRDARIDSFPICVTAFIADSDEDQRSQFILVNSTKPLPKGLIYELLPSTVGMLPVPLQQRQFPAHLLYRLNGIVDSPLYRMIQTPTIPEGKIKDNSILKMLINSLSDGALYGFRDPRTGRGDEEAMLSLLMDFWSAVRSVFTEAWDKPPRQSRLMHGVGIVSLGFLMDAMFDRYSRSRIPSEADFGRDLSEVAEVCHWTSGSWNLGADTQRRWNELQNTTRDIRLLTNYLLFEYKARVWSRPLP